MKKYQDETFLSLAGWIATAKLLRVTMVISIVTSQQLSGRCRAPEFLK
jgi:hypothetical protein